MQFLKNTPRASVRMLTNGHIEKIFRHRGAVDRLRNEALVLQHLEARECPFVPRLLDWNIADRRLVMSNCGHAVQHLPLDRVASLFAELADYEVRHDDPELRNITYDPRAGRFCVIDFEFATILTQTEVSLRSVPWEQTLETAEALVQAALL